MEIVLRAVAVYALLWVLLRAMGKRELAEVTAFELVLLVVLGDIIQQGVTQEDMSVTGSALAASTMALLAVGSSVVGHRFARARPLLEGRPSIVVRDGVVQDDVLDLQRITRDELDEAARKRGLDDLADVAWGHRGSRRHLLVRRASCSGRPGGRPRVTGRGPARRVTAGPDAILIAGPSLSGRGALPSGEGGRLVG